MLIGIMGTKGSGKDTMADFLVSHHHFIKRSMASPLKEACQKLFLFSDKQMFDSEEKEKPDSRWFGCTPRRALQYVGTDLLRDNLENIMPGIQQDVFIVSISLWLNETMKKNPQTNVVVPDIRFQNEINFIKKNGGLIIKIDRPSIEKIDQHSSEKDLQEIRDFDYYIVNDSSKEDLFIKTENVYMNIKNNIDQSSEKKVSNIKEIPEVVSTKMESKHCSENYVHSQYHTQVNFII